MNFPSQLSEERTEIPGSSRVLPEQTIFASCLVLLALAALLAQRYDEPLLLFLYRASDVGSARVWRVTSLLGSGMVLAPLVAAVSLILLWLRQGTTGLGLALGWAATSWTVECLKWLVVRSRPPVPHWADVMGNSFPSGHAAQSLYVYLYLGLTLACSGSLPGRRVPGKSLRKAAPWLLAAIPLAVGASRVFLGVHWPSDVVGGWAIGLFFCGLAWLLQSPDRGSQPNGDGN